MTNPTKTALQIYWAAHQPEIDWLFDQSFPFAVSLQGSLKRFGGADYQPVICPAQVHGARSG